MTDKEIQKLRRSELLEILYSLRKEVDSLQAENEALKKKLEEQNSVFGEILSIVKETNTIIKGEETEKVCCAEETENTND